MKVMVVGDPHCTVRNIEEAEKLFRFIYEQANLYEVDHVELLGDLNHNHAVIRMEVKHFWETTFKKFESVSTWAIVGNHDQIGNREKEQQMNSLTGLGCTVISRPTIHNNIAYIPYMSDHAAFLTAAQDLYDRGATKLLVAHQTFTGATYENGFYAEDGIDPALVPQEAIISGHIHKQQQIGKCFYPGTAKWDSMADANEDKGIWIFEHNSDGSIKSKQFISTKDAVTPIVKHTFNEGDREVELNDKAKNYIELVGSTAWITLMKKKYKGLAAIKARPTDRKHVSVDKDKIFSMVDYLDTVFKPIDGVTREDIKGYLNEVLGG
jgi:DNA repair exonuclease SbcCD nuclease subunit